MISRLFGLLTGEAFKVGNPFLWRTKTDIIARIRDLGLADLLPKTHSCANVRSANRMRPHCGRCSQCIDRRFAILAAGCPRDDPAEMYEVDLLEGDRLGDDREIALAYVRSARAWRSLTPEALIEEHPEVMRVLAGIDMEPSQGLKAVTRLCARHGQTVTEIMEKALRDIPDDLPTGSLAALYAAADRPSHPPAGALPTPAPARLLVEIDEILKVARLGGLVVLKTANYEALVPLVETHLACLGAGCAPEDFAFVSARDLLKRWNLADESSVRRRIRALRKTFEALDAREDAIIETLPWHGYRLRPEAVTVRRSSLPEALSPPKISGSLPAAARG